MRPPLAGSKQPPNAKLPPTTPAAGTPNPTGRGDYLTSAQLSERLNIPAEQLSKWRQRREGPPYYRITRQHVRYSIAELEAWLATKRIPA